MLSLYNQTCLECSSLITRRYSTSFSMGIRVFDKKYRSPIYAIYGFVRFADEIVDTFHDFPKKELLDKFRRDTFEAIESGISLNPVLHSFQNVVNKYNIERELIDAFLDSMEMDLNLNAYEDNLYQKYIYGSAEVVGLMCLRVFVNGDDNMYKHLYASARSLGSAFQKINFLRDIKSDFDERGRVYFPGVDFRSFSLGDKLQIESDIKKDFDDALLGITQLPQGVRFGVYLAYKYYTKLFQKIKSASPTKVKEERIRVKDSRKVVLIFSSAFRLRFNLF
ncbi:MAG: phytoene/squalene synthase family protein [Saprospiraceae bacterium]|jgi:15-cis-phytoene synthase|nr:phytoene/squalene synthase family protein [Saprospiraceae bacterium]MDP4700466.1 phytoene/squalene synthase family protein [Saprospiraceae bacterium]MDP4815876.1 phytoene/squalene synthase family protein [Saprospiraceae bacterium]MDP4915592.1 phytoene/squalene synthase family protein [Saprospiraceae bacterium]MDP5047093.1 phytoene/squalene synthase family protein [Saprospiraceae bacterium]